MVEFCPEHTEIVMFLGGLKRGQDDIRETLIKIETSLDKMANKQTDVRLNAVKEGTKSSILYWVIGIVSGAFILGIVNLVFKALGIWNTGR